MRIYIICPVRTVTPVQSQALDDYVQELEELHDHQVHYPPRDVGQSDPHGKDIIRCHSTAMFECDEVHIYWDKHSTGSLFDLGLAYMRMHCHGMNFHLINPEDCPATDHKSFNNVVRWLCGRDEE